MCRMDDEPYRYVMIWFSWCNVEMDGWIMSNCPFMGKFLVYGRVLLIVDERYLGL